MAGKWDWLKDEMKGFKGLKNLPIILKFIKGRVQGPDDITKCTLCPNMCRHACPVGIVDGKETTSPSGKSRISYLIENNQIDLTLENLYPVYMCLSCGCCEKYCPFNFSVSDILQPVKNEAIKKDIIFDEFKEILRNLKNHGYIYGEPKKRKIEDKNISNKKTKETILYISGCTFREKYPEIPDKAVNIFINAGYNVLTLDDENCCGIPAYNIGDIETFKEIARENIEKINSKNFDYIVTSCPSCAYAFRVLYKQNQYKFKKEVLHITEFLNQKEKDFNFSLKEKITITYHDPCKLANGLKKPDSMNTLLQKIEGINIKTPRRKGDKTFCCGYGGSTLCRLNRDLSDDISKERLNELSDLSKNIITSCPTCKESFEKNKEDEIKIYDIVELIDEYQK